MAAIIAVYLGGIAVLLGAVLLFVRWRIALPLLAAGLAAGSVGLILPAPERNSPSARTRLDDLVPRYQFHERHQVATVASCARAYQALLNVTAGEITFFRTLTWIRRLGRPGAESILNPPADAPLLKVATRSGFMLLANQEDREIVLGTVVLMPPGGRRPENPDQFTTLSEPGYGKAALNFHWEPTGTGGCIVTTETRVFATDPEARRTFGKYWRVIYPGSALIRRMWLRAVKRRAERGEVLAPSAANGH
ncbi:MAG TPA: hypothetical protein VGA78_06015 [Gemmatimonadales bacterium]